MGNTKRWWCIVEKSVVKIWGKKIMAKMWTRTKTGYTKYIRQMEKNFKNE